MRLSQGAASLALGYVLVGLSARLVARGLRDGGMGAGYWACVFSVCRFVMLLPFQGAGLAACVSPRVSLRLPWAMCWLGFQPALWCGVCGMGAWVRAIGRAYFPCCSFVMLLPFQGAGLAVCVFPRVPLRLPWAMCWLGFQPALWCGVCGMGHGCGHRTCKEKSSPPVLFAGWGGLSCRCPRRGDGGLTCP